MKTKLRDLTLVLVFFLSLINSVWIIRYEPQAPIILNIEMIEPTGLNNFENMAELERFLQVDKTNELNYVSDFKCLQFAETLCRNGAEHGYLITVLVDAWLCNPDIAHAYVMVFCEEEQIYAVIEPQDDKIEWTWPRQPPQ